MLWTDTAIVLSARPFGEGKAIASVLAAVQGRYCGVVPGGGSGKRRYLLQPGSLVSATWRARVPEQLGVLTLELLHGLDTTIIHDRLRLAALTAACSLLDAGLPEREPNNGLFHHTLALLQGLGADEDGYLNAYARWERLLVAALGFGLAAAEEPAVESVNADFTAKAPGEGATSPSTCLPSAADAEYVTMIGASFGNGCDHAPPRRAAADTAATQLRRTLRALEEHVFATGRHSVPFARSRFAVLIEADRR